ncbi:MAG: hypothetical protein SGI90_14325 [Candidatus Eisenbacteria bacterium]|nr:hypothetical protein [Candidatus Eisenbacteria bacterium]
MPERLRSWLFVLPIFLLAAALRLSQPTLDPPASITGGPTPNEGLYLLNARHQAVAGVWRMDDWDASVLHPLGSRIHAAAFEWFGTGLRGARTLTALLSLAGIALFHFLVRRAGGAGTALLATLFLSVNGIHVIYSRQANPAPLALVLMFLTIFLWEMGRRRPAWSFLSGTCLALAAFVENGPHNFFFLATALLATLMVRLQAWKMPWSGPTRRRIRLFWFGALGVIVGWVVLLVRPEFDVMIRMLESPLGRIKLGNVAQNLFMAPFNFYDLIRWVPGLVVIGLVYLLVFARSLFAPIARHRRLSEVRIWFFAWMVTAPIYFALRWDRPLGVLVLLIPPLCVAVAEALVALMRLTQVRKPEIDVMVVLGLIGLTIWMAVQITVHTAVTLGYRSLPPAFFEHQFRYEFLLVVTVALPLVILASHLWLRWKQRMLAVSKPVALTLFCLGTAGVLASDVLVVRAIHAGASPDVLTAARVLRELPPGAVMAGSWAPTLSLDSGRRGLVVWRGMNDANPVETYGITHLILQRDSRESPGVNPAFGIDATAVLLRMKLVGVHRVGRTVLELHDLSGAVAPSN